jgi:hypothetical protein
MNECTTGIMKISVARVGIGVVLLKVRPTVTFFYGDHLLLCFLTSANQENQMIVMED